MPQSASNHQPRKGGGRNRTACLTCRIRKVKCDERRPSCVRCTSTGRECDGYAQARLADGEEARQNRRPLAPKTISTALMPLNRLPSLPLGLTEQECNNFDFFRLYSSREFPGVYKSALWDHLVLQLSHREPSIRHASIAVGAMHRAYRGMSSAVHCADIFQSRHAFALQQYVKALEYLQLHISTCDGSDSYSAEVALIACLLFICFELLQSNRSGALAHLDTGLQLLIKTAPQYRSSEQSPYLSLAANKGVIGGAKAITVYEELTGTFTRLYYQSHLLDGRSNVFREKPTELVLAIRDFVSRSDLVVPPIFFSLDEAAKCLHSIFDQSFQLLVFLIEQSTALAAEECSSDSTYPHNSKHSMNLPTSVLRHRELRIRLQVARDATNRWINAFHSFLNTGAGASVTRSKLAIQLEMQHFHQQYQFEQIMASAGVCEAPVDINSRFEGMLSLGEIFVENETTYPKATFTVESGIIPTVCLIGLKCQESNLRQRAISLLKRLSCQEGLCEALAAAELVEAAGETDTAEEIEATGSVVAAEDVNIHCCRKHQCPAAAFAAISKGCSQNPTETGDKATDATCPYTQWLILWLL